jgi:hypothetical protein
MSAPIHSWTRAKSLTSNLKSPDGQPYSLPLGQYVLLIGPNQSNKSAIAESIQLALSGQVAGLPYKSKPAKVDPLLTAMIPWGETEGSAQVALSNGEKSSWALTAGKRANHSGAKHEALALAEVRAAMAGSDQTRAKFLYRNLCAPLPARELLAEVPWTHHAVLSLVWPGIEEKESKPIPLDKLLSAIMSRRTQKSKESASCLAVLAGLGSVEEISDDHLEGLRRELSRAAVKEALKTLYVESQRNPQINASDAIEHLADLLGGKRKVGVIPSWEEAWEKTGQALLDNRLSTIAKAAARAGAKHAARADLLQLAGAEVFRVLLRELHKREKDLIARTSRYLPPGEKLAIDWGDSPVPDRVRLGLVGLDGGTQIHFTLSGSTEARFLAALACAVASPRAPLIVVEDRMWDTNTLARTMAALEKSPAQVILMSTIKPKGKRRKAWQYVELSRTPGKPLEIQTTRED